MKKLKSSLISVLKGLAIPAIAIFVFALIVGLFMSLTLLVISIEEGTGNLSDSSMSLTWAVLLFAQGVGLGFDDFVLTIIPLGLTILLVSSLAIAMRKLKGGQLANSIGLFVWVFANSVISQNTNIELLDSLPIILLKSVCVYILAMMIAVFPYSSTFAQIKQKLAKHFSERIIKCAKICFYCSVSVLVIYAIVALLTIIFWCVVGSSNVEIAFSKLGMQIGSRILTSIACLVWLPNIALWALSWISGAGFNIGDIASFSIFSVSKKSLPPIPLFAIFPDAIKDSFYRTASVSILFVLCAILASFIILYSKLCNLRIIFDNNKVDWKKTAFAFVQSAIVLVASCMAIILVMSVLLLFANGSLGRFRLAHVGVNVSKSLRSLGHLTIYGFGFAWIVILFVCAIIIGIRLLSNKILSENQPLLESKTETSNLESTRTVSSKAYNK